MSLRSGSARRRRLAGALAAASAAAAIWAPLTADASSAARSFRIGLLTPTPSAFSSLSTTVWLRALGYREGENTVFLRRFTREDDELVMQQAADLAAAEVDVIVAAGTPAIRAARRATGSIPIVMVTGDDPVRAGLVASLERPGGNVTGVSAALPDVQRRRLALLRDAVPGLRLLGVLWNPGDPGAREEWRAAAAAARALGLDALSIEAPTAAAVAPAVTAAAREGAGALLILADPLFFRHAPAIGAAAMQARLPSMYPSAWFLESHEGNGLLAFGPSSFDLALNAARYVDRILRGARPATLPVLRLPRYEFVVDMHVARALGVTVPVSVLIRADRVLR